MGDEVIDGDGEGLRQRRQGADRAGHFARFDARDDVLSDAGAAGEFGLGEAAMIAENPERLLAAEDALGNGGREGLGAILDGASAFFGKTE